MFSSTDPQLFCLWSTKDSLHPRKSRDSPFSVAWTAGDACVCRVHVSFHPSRPSASTGFVSVCPAQLLCCCGTSLTYHIASWAPGSWFQYPSQQQAHPGSVPLTPHLLPISSWQHSQETLLLIYMAKCTSGMTVI